MSTTNRKPPQAKEAPAAPFKRSVAGCLRAIAGKTELEITYGTDRPSLTPDRARLP